MHQALYRKYRPQTFDDVIGQQAVTQTLKNQVKSGSFVHAYLLPERGEPAKLLVPGFWQRQSIAWI